MLTGGQLPSSRCPPGGCGSSRSPRWRPWAGSVGSNLPVLREVPGSAACGSSELLEDDLELVLCFHHVQEKGHVVAVVLDDVIVHVHQDPAGKGEGLGQTQHKERFAERLGQEGWTLGVPSHGWQMLTVQSLGAQQTRSQTPPQRIPIANSLSCPASDAHRVPRPLLVQAAGSHSPGRDKALPRPPHRRGSAIGTSLEPQHDRSLRWSFSQFHPDTPGPSVCSTGKLLWIMAGSKRGAPTWVRSMETEREGNIPRADVNPGLRFCAREDPSVPQ